MEKLCKKCNTIKPIEDFAKHSKYGLQAYCKPCQYSMNKEYKSNNTDKIKAYNKQYYQDHKEYYQELNKIYRENSKGNYIYVLKQNGEYMYLGSTQNLRYRMYNHLNLNSNISNYIKENSWTSIEYIEIEEDLTREDLYFIEHIMINEICPSLNKRSTYSIDNATREEELTDLAYSILDYLEDLLITYKTNPNSKAYYINEFEGLEDFSPDLTDFIGCYYISEEDDLEYV